MKSGIKSIIIKVSIGFIAVVALLTYFSGTIDSYLLPHVTVTYGGEGRLTYSMNTTSVIEPFYDDDSESTCIRFFCEPSVEHFVQLGATVEFKVSVEADEGLFVYRKGYAVVKTKREAEEGIECTAQIKEIELKEGEAAPSVGDMAVINTVFESKPYSHIVMKSAIQSDDSVYVVGKGEDNKRTVTKIPVTILDESEFYAAVDMSNDSLPLVLTATKELSDGQRVIVDG